MGMIRENIDRINAEKAKFAESVGKTEQDVLLVAVTKTRTADEINEAIDAGITDIGKIKYRKWWTSSIM